MATNSLSNRDALVAVFSLFSNAHAIRELGHVGSVCKTWEIASRENALWRPILKTLDPAKNEQLYEQILLHGCGKDWLGSVGKVTLFDRGLFYHSEPLELIFFPLGCSTILEHLLPSQRTVQCHQPQILKHHRDTL